MWNAELDFAAQAAGPIDSSPTIVEARKTRCYVAQQAAAAGGRCQLCDAGELHGAGECELVQALTAPNQLDPATSWQRGIVDHRVPSPAAAAAAALLPLKNQAEAGRGPDVYRYTMTQTGRPFHSCGPRRRWTSGRQPPRAQ